ncbi:phage tail spike protein [Pseudolactococcus raffinolactis]|uniref:phage tail spike protein n=1 Tax=Pseudolactococcus raffinolactis TaxID=1366 RepID=UPI0014367C01|nr:phage tail spike protein [Lactococcus raffinolactis]QIW50795.1 hypothetical protein GU337_02315 [Lactococcus raffinolactis]
MITLFIKNETNFETNGIGSLDESIINPEINWKDNGAFTLEFKYPLFAKHGFEIENSSIIRANDPEGSNLFFVYKITPSMGYVTVLCYQISYKLAFNSINDTNIVNKSGQNALSQMSSATQYPHGFVFSSDISTTATSRVVRKNPIEFLLDTGLDNSFVNRWGGHIVRHNFNIAMNTAYGSNKGYTIRHKKDLTGYEAEFDESTVITRIRPIGYDGLLLPEKYVDSPLLNAYTEPRIQQFEYSEVKVKTKDTDEEGFSTPELAYAELRRLANLEFSKSKVDQPDFSAKVEFVNLKETQEYQDLRSLKQLLPGDTVKVIHSDDNFDIEAQMVEYKYNPLNNSYISITLGNYTKSFTSKVANTQTEISKVKETAQNALTSASGKNTVYSLTYKPPITASSTEGDLLYLKNGDKIELWILEKVDGKLQWVLQVSDATSEELKAQMQQAQNDIKDAVDSANLAVDKADASVTAIQANTQLINDVNAIANNAKTQANDAVTNAQTAITNAQTALEKANGVSSKVTTIETNIDTINGTLSSKANTTDLNALKGKVSTAESSITQNANDIKLKANQTDVNTIDGKVSSLDSSLTVQSGQITALNTKTDGQTTQIGSLQSSYNGLTSTVSSVVTGSTNETLISTQMISSTTLKHPNYPDMPMVEIPVVNGETYTVTSNHPLENNVAHVFYIRATTTQPLTAINGVYDGRGITLPAISDKIYVVFRTQGYADRFINGQYWLKVTKTPVSQIQVSQLSQDLSGFKTTVANTYADKSTVASQINQSATQVTQNVQSWTNGKLNSYSTIQSTDSSIASAVADKASQSQLTQLSNQFTSTVSQLSNSTNLFSIKRMQISNDYHSAYPSFLLVRVPTDIGATYIASTDNPSQNLWFLPDINSDPAALTYRVYKGKTVTFTATNTISYAVIRDTLTKEQLSNETYHLKIERGTRDTLWSPSEIDSVSRTQFTQSIDNINLRIVEKGNVTSQINLESGRVLIDTNQLLLNANTVKFSGSAFIPNAMIQELSAEKITAGTLNAANVNVINLNARSLTAGTISGSNLSINLDTGSVQFQKGYIAGNNNKIRFDLDNNYFHSLNSGGSGFKISDGQLSFFDGFFGSTPQYLGGITLDAFSSGFSGIKVYGSKGASIQGGGNAITVGYSLFGNDKIGISGNTGVTGNLSVMGNLSVTGSKNAVHVTRDGLRATPAYETAESYLGDIGGNYTRENCEVWVDIEKLFSDTVNTDVAYHVFLQSYDDARFWVAEFKSDKFLIKSDKPMARFAWEIKAKRRGYESDRLVIQEGFDNKMLLDAQEKGVF